MYTLPKKVTRNDTETHKRSQGTDEQALDKMDILCKKFEDLVLLITKSKPKPNIQDVICHKCEKPGYYTSQ